MILLQLRHLPDGQNVTDAVSDFTPSLSVTPVLKNSFTTSERFIACCGNGYPLLKVVPKRDFLFDRYHALG